LLVVAIQRADEVLDGDAAEALAEVVADHLGPVARNDHQALDAVAIEGTDEALEDRHAAHRNEALGQRFSQGPQPGTEASGEQQCGPYLRAIGREIVTMHRRSSQRDPLETRRQEGSGCSAAVRSLSVLRARH
jgi:hypothetical protein